jgi:hypothetical protein
LRAVIAVILVVHAFKEGLHIGQVGKIDRLLIKALLEMVIAVGAERAHFLTVNHKARLKEVLSDGRLNLFNVFVELGRCVARVVAQIGRHLQDRVLIEVVLILDSLVSNLNFEHLGNLELEQ